GRRLGYEPADFLRRRRVRDNDDAQSAREPTGKTERVAAFHVPLELMCAETPWRCAAPRRVELAHFEYRQRLDVRGIGNVERPQRAVRPAAALRHLLRAVRVVLFVDGNRNALLAERFTQGHERVRRLREGRMIV